MSRVRIPSVLRQHTANEREVVVGGETVGAVLEGLMERHPALRDQLTADGDLHRFVNVYLNGQDVRYLQQLQTPVGPNDTVQILPAMAGGAVARDATDERLLDGWGLRSHLTRPDRHETAAPTMDRVDLARRPHRR